MTAAFPRTPDFTDFNEPVRLEYELYDLVVDGEIPSEIKGSWYRSVPDPQYPPMLGDDTFISGDGMVSRLRFDNGHVDMSMRYVQTARLQDDRAARRSLHGLYRNPYTDDESVAGRPRGAANTTPLYHAGRLFALKEDSRPMELDPVTLATLGEWDFAGRLRSQTMTAHPRIYRGTGELHFYGYEAGGLATRDVAYCVADESGALIREEWFEAPYVGLVHDFVVTREHVVFPFFPITADAERIKAGGAHWIWEPEKGTVIGVMPRDGTVKDIRWFRGPACSVFHFMNAFSEGRRLYVDACKLDMNPFPFISRASGIEHDMRKVGGALVRWTFDLGKPGEEFAEDVLAPGGDVPRIADADSMTDYAVGWYGRYDPEVGPPLNAGPLYVGFNSVQRLEINTGRTRRYAVDDRTTLNEPLHIPSQQPGHEGYLAVVVDRHDTMLNEIHLLEAARPDNGPLARIHSPVRLRPQIHGSWVPAAELE